MSEVSEPVLARYDGICGHCGDVMRADKDKIVHLDDEDCWVHERCAVEEGYIEEGSP